MNEKQVKGSFGTVEYLDNNVITVPLQFDEPVLITSKTVFDFSEFTGDNLFAPGLNLDYGVVGKGDTNQNYEIQIIVPAGKQGSFKLELKYPINDPKNFEQNITGIVEPIIIEFDTPSIDQRVERLEKVILFLMAPSSGSSYDNKSGEEMMRDALPASDKVRWVSNLLRQFESSEKAIEQYHDLFEERLGRIDK
ncbi:MAG: hypothetical protein OXU36_18940 [Candidatus Poribacteria bacterium]|nr:hypothetical protein [Candidatus Poribacteria bacterium]